MTKRKAKIREDEKPDWGERLNRHDNSKLSEMGGNDMLNKGCCNTGENATIPNIGGYQSSGNNNCGCPPSTNSGIKQKPNKVDLLKELLNNPRVESISINIERAGDVEETHINANLRETSEDTIKLERVIESFKITIQTLCNTINKVEQSNDTITKCRLGLINLK